MFEDEARALVEGIRASGSHSFRWEDQWSRYDAEVHFEKDRGFVLKLTEQSHDSASPAQHSVRVPSESELIGLLCRVEAEDDAQGIRIDPKIRIGKVHRTLCALKAIVCDYDSGTRSKELPAGSLLQPWRPLTSNSKEIPITLGVGATCFDWGVAAIDGHFLSFEDFFNRCEALPEEGQAHA